MDVFPAVNVARFEQLRPGDLFIYLSSRGNCVALKTQPPANGDPCLVALLGPNFPGEIKAAHLVAWQAATAVSFGQDFSVLLPNEPSGWSDGPPADGAPCLAIVDDKIYLRINGAQAPDRFFPYFVELATGALVESRLKGIAAYALAWEFAILSANLPARSILKYPHS